MRGGRDCEYDTPEPRAKVRVLPLVDGMDEKFLQAFTYCTWRSSLLFLASGLFSFSLYIAKVRSRVTLKLKLTLPSADIREMFPVDPTTNPSGMAATQTWRPQTTLAMFASKPVLLILAGAHYITKMSLRAGVDPVIGELAALTPAWQNLHAHMIETIKELNRKISDPTEHYRTVLQIIAALFTVEMAIPDTAWSAHLEGLSVLIKEYGGVLDLVDTGINTVILKVQAGICYSTVGNTTSPVSRQIAGYLDWTPTEISAAYSHNIMSGFPCPTVLFHFIIRITKLRVRCRSLLCFPKTLVCEVLGLMDAIEEFDPETWEEPYSFDSQPSYLLWGHTFKAALGLYLCASLPPVLIAKAAPPSYESAKRNYVDRLMASISALQLTDDYSVHGLAWPLAVLGVGVVDLEFAYRCRIEEMFVPLCVSPIADPISSTLLLKKLKTFWMSGRTSWDACFYAPYNVITV